MTENVVDYANSEMNEVIFKYFFVILSYQIDLNKKLKNKSRFE